MASLRAAKPSDTEAIQAVWDASSSHDDPARAVGSWATATQVMVLDGRVIGVAAVRVEAAPDGAMPARIALEAAARQEDRAVALVQASVDMVREAGGERIRLTVEDDLAAGGRATGGVQRGADDCAHALACVGADTGGRPGAWSEPAVDPTWRGSPGAGSAESSLGGHVELRRDYV